MWDYSEKVLDHFFNPRNMGIIEDADAVADVGNIACGDALRLSIKVHEGKIVDVKFKTFGCGSAIAAASALTEMIKGKSLDEAMRISNQDIAEFLDGLPKEKMHCSVMGQEALEKAIAIYQGRQLPPEEEAGYLCKCFRVTEEKIRSVVKQNRLKSPDDVTHFTKAGGGCQKCLPRIQEVLDQVWKELDAEDGGDRPHLTNVQLVSKVQEVFETQVRSQLKLHNGDAELVDVVENRVIVRLKGACEGCPHTKATLKGLVEKLLHSVDPTLEVEEAGR